MIPLALAFVGLDLAALALLGPVSPADTANDVARLYGDDATRVLVSRFVHCLGLVVAFGFFGLVCGRLRRDEGGAGTLSRIIFGGFVALVPIEIARNVVMATLALRFDDIADSALALHLVAVLLGPAIAFPIAAALIALAALRRSPLAGAVAAAWLLSGARLLTTSTVVWYAGFTAFVALIALLLYVAVQLGRPSREASTAL